MCKTWILSKTITLLLSSKIVQTFAQHDCPSSLFRLTLCAPYIIHNIMHSKTIFQELHDVFYEGECILKFLWEGECRAAYGLIRSLAHHWLVVENTSQSASKISTEPPQ